jgi:starch synthase
MVDRSAHHGVSGSSPAFGQDALVRVVFVTAELSPLATVGGLASAAAGLCLELRRQGVGVDIVLPDYGDVALIDEVVSPVTVPDWVGAATVRTGRHPAVGAVRLVSVPGMARSHPYLQPSGEGWPDNDERFFRFSRAVAAILAADPPDVVHLNDWHTAAVLAATQPSLPSVLSIHNLAYQGTADATWLDVLGPRAEHFEWWGTTNPLSGAIALADRVVAVSPTYAAEITTPEGGFGLDGPLRARGAALTGVLNGIDTEVWDPRTDPHLAAKFARSTLADRSENRSALLGRLGFPDDAVPLAVVVSRLTHQKGIDLLVPLVPVLADAPCRVAILGAGDAVLAAELRRLAGEHPDTLAFVEGYDEELSHLMFGGADLYLMPSRFEPCGLTQMQAMRYGAIPVVTAVGGLVDTVVDVDAHPASGVGFVAGRADPVFLLSALHRAVGRVRDRRRRGSIQRRMMSHDWSWRVPASQYLAMYREITDSDGPILTGRS